MRRSNTKIKVRQCKHHPDIGSADSSCWGRLFECVFVSSKNLSSLIKYYKNFLLVTLVIICLLVIIRSSVISALNRVRRNSQNNMQGLLVLSTLLPHLSKLEKNTNQNTMFIVFQKIWKRYYKVIKISGGNQNIEMEKTGR